MEPILHHDHRWETDGFTAKAEMVLAGNADAGDNEKCMLVVLNHEDGAKKPDRTGPHEHFVFKRCNHNRKECAAEGPKHMDAKPDDYCSD